MTVSHPGATMSVPKALLWTLPMLALTALLLGGGGQEPPRGARLVAYLVDLAFVNALFFAMLRSGRTDRYRAILFIGLAIAFVAGFIPNLLETRGNIALSQADMLEGKTPFCHVVIPMTIVPAALTRTIIFPGSILDGFANVASMFVLWIAFTIVMGRGFCSWGCFFGGLDELFSRLRRTRVVKHIHERWTYFPYAMLLFVVVASAATLSPTYCEWFCPFKAVTEFEAVTSFKILVQTVLFVILFVALVLVLPVVTGRRTQCGLFCPFGAFQALVGRIAPFDVRLERDRCGRGCTLCVHTCPSFALSEASIEAGRTRSTCSLCGKCVDACTKNALHYHVKGTEVGGHPRAARLLFLFPSFLFLSVFSAGTLQGFVVRLVHLATTGRYLMG